jgi:hypothetical protein
MSITDKTRKTLWAKSGNRCLLCRIELVQNTDGVMENVIIGEECHIISVFDKGPRGDVQYSGDFDGYDNLILLCANDHKRVDELTDIYTVESLRLFKVIHETWVKTTLEKDVMAFTNDQQNVKSLPKITSGKQIVDIINGVHMFDFNHDELKTEDEAAEIGGLFEELKETGDILSDIGYEEVAKFGIRLNEEVDKLKQMGFLLFGMRRKLRLRNDKKEDMGLYDTASLIAVRQDNPSIVGDFLIAKFPTNISFGL